VALTQNQIKYARQRIVETVFGVTPVTVTKAQIDTVSTTATAWLESNAVAFQTALNGTVAQGQPPPTLAAILAAVAEARYGGVA
jgi:predicted aconitase